MKFVKVLVAVAFAVALTASLAIAADKEEKAKHPPGTVAKCCAKSAKDGKVCEHPCCVEAAKNKKNCEKCPGGTNEAPKAK